MALAQPAQQAQNIDTGLTCLLMLARYFGIPADPHQLRHEFSVSGKLFGDMEILRAAKRLGLKMGKRATTWARLSTLCQPAIAQYKDGNYVVLARAEGDKILVHDPRASQPQVLEERVFAEALHGTLILCTTRAGLQSARRMFDSLNF
jgi:ATP-binding cassette, subfamily B, bacterial HlyB/CyaB